MGFKRREAVTCEGTIAGGDGCGRCYNCILDKRKLAQVGKDEGDLSYCTTIKCSMLINDTCQCGDDLACLCKG